jgi:hypothetical protein
LSTRETGDRKGKTARRESTKRPGIKRQVILKYGQIKTAGFGPATAAGPHHRLQLGLRPQPCVRVYLLVVRRNRRIINVRPLLCSFGLVQIRPLYGLSKGARQAPTFRVMLNAFHDGNGFYVTLRYPSLPHKRHVSLGKENLLLLMLLLMPFLMPLLLLLLIMMMLLPLLSLL